MPLFLKIFIFFAINIMMYLNAYNFVDFVKTGFLNNKDKIIISSVLYFGKIYLILFILGFFGILDARNLYLLIFIIELLNCAIYLKGKKFKYPSIDLNDINITKNQFVYISFILFLSLYLFYIFKGSITPPLNGDSLLYHLPMVINWIKEKSLLITGNSPFDYYPANSELLSLWLLLPFINDTLVNYQNILIMIIGFVALNEISKYYLAGSYRLIFLISVFSIPIISYQISTQENDILILSLFCIIYYLLKRYKQNYNFIFLVAAAISTGLIFGMKYNMLLICIFPISILFERLTSRNKKITFLRSIITVVLIIIFGGFWYFRNWVILGSPIYPLSINVFNIEIFKAKNVLGLEESFFFFGAK